MMKFEDLGLEESLLRGVEKMGYREPMPVQAEVIPHLLTQDVDLVALAQTGTGKTAAFGLPLLQKVSGRSRFIQSLILCPTRELCLQTHEDLLELGQFKKNLRISAIYGGASIENQIRELEKGPQILVATPGRLLDMIRRGKADLHELQNLILDEADEMLNMGFAEEIGAIFESTSAEKRVALFSATMPNDVARIAGKYMRNTKEIVVGNRNAAAEQLTHQVYLAKPGDRYAVVRRIVDFHPNLYAIVFCRTRQETKDMSERLWQDGYSADALHGDLSQAQRETVMARFRSRRFSLLIATDVAARGIDVSDLSHVIHLNLPQDEAAYTHRSGRTGRAGKSGISVLIAMPSDRFRLQRMEKQLGVRFEFMPVPDARAVCRNMVLSRLDRLDDSVRHSEQIDPYMELILSRCQGLSREELIKRWLAAELGKDLFRYQNAPDLNLPVQAAKSPIRRNKAKDPRSAESVEFSKLMVNLGKRNKVNPMTVMGLVADVTGKRNIEIGRIEIFKSFTYFEVDRLEEKRVLKGFESLGRKGAALKVTKVTGTPKEFKTPVGKMRRGVHLSA